MYTYAVWHAKHVYDETGRPTGVIGDFGFNPTVFPRDYTHVATVEVDRLSQVFDKTNTITHPWTQNAGVTVHASTHQLRSTSMQDVIQLVSADGLIPSAVLMTRVWVVATVGYTTIDLDPSGHTTIPAQWGTT